MLSNIEMTTVTIMKLIRVEITFQWKASTIKIDRMLWICVLSMFPNFVLKGCSGIHHTEAITQVTPKSVNT